MPTTQFLPGKISLDKFGNPFPRDTMVKYPPLLPSPPPGIGLIFIPFKCFFTIWF